MVNSVGRGSRRSDRDAVDRRRRLVIAGGLCSVLALAACGGGGGGEKANEAAEQVTRTTGSKPETRNSTSTTVTTVPAEQTIELGLKAWYGGFAIGFEKATVKTNSTGLSARSVRLTLSLANSSANVGRLNSQDISLMSGGASTLSGLSDLPQVPGKATANATLSFLVDEKFNLSDATVIFGPPDSNQMIVPLSQAGKIQTFEPRELTVTGTASTPDLRVDLKGGRLDASYVRGEKGKLDLRLEVDETNTGTGRGGYFLTATQFSLNVPGGTSVVANTGTPGDLVAEAVASGATLSGKAVAFKVPTPGPGGYTLVYKSGDGATAQIPFTIA